MMASATAINIKTVPTKTIGALLVAGAGYGLSRLDVRSTFLNVFTGPGSTSRIIAIVIVLANIKNFPYVWHVSIVEYNTGLLQETHSIDPLLDSSMACNPQTLLDFPTQIYC